MELVDKDGENKAVRAFLMGYGGCGISSVAAMKAHMDACGYPFWPTWCDDLPKRDYTISDLTKAGAQSWLRHLFNIEKDPHHGS